MPDVPPVTSPAKTPPNFHPLFQESMLTWEKLTDAYLGEDQVKSKGLTYLPATEGMVIDGMGNSNLPGQRRYDSYKIRAVFPDFYKQAVEAMVGIMHRQDARIIVPDKMLPLLDRLTSDGESAQMLLRKLNTEQLKIGRAGMLVEVPDGAPANALPYVVFYPGTAIANWDEGSISDDRHQNLEFVMLDESNYERIESFQWQYRNHYRFLIMSGVLDDIASNDQSVSSATGEYQSAVVGPAGGIVPSPEDWKTPALGGKTLDYIPFVFVNTKDLVTTPDIPPLLGLANLCFTIYRGEADYRQCLFLQGQETLVIVGADTESSTGTRLGAGAKIDLPLNADAKFIGVSAAGLSAMKAALDGDRAHASEQTSKLFDGGGHSAGSTYQSGEALRIRVSAKTATLREIAATSGMALKRVLQIMAEWIGEDPDAITVEPNVDFAETQTASRTALELGQAKQIGVPLSQESIHRYLVQNDLTIYTFDEEKAKIQAEEPLIPPQPTAPGASGAAGGNLGRATGGSRVKRGVGA